MALSQGQVQQQASMSVMKMAIGDVKLQGDELQKLLSTADPSAIQRAAQPHLGGKIDLKG